MVRKLTHNARARHWSVATSAGQRGLTLIELLIVMLVVAMAAGVVAFNMPPSTSEARKEAERFAARLSVAGEQAIMSGSVIGMELEADGYRFYRYDRGEWRDLALGPQASRQLGAGRFPPDIAVDFTVLEPARRNEDEQQRRAAAERERRAQDDETIATPNVFFSPTGETTALTISFKSRRAALTVSLDNTGVLEGPVEDRS